MKNLNQLLAESNFYTAENIPAKWKESQYFDHKMSTGKKDLPAFLQGLENYESGLFYHCTKCTEHSGQIVYSVEDYAHIFIKAKDNNFILELSNARRTWTKDKDKFYFFLPYYVTRKFDVLDYHQRSEAIKHIPEPNKFATATTKKIDAWFTYQAEVLESFEQLLKTTTEKADNNRQQINDFIKAIPGAKVWDRGNITEVTTKNFVVKFEIYKSGYMSTQTVYNGTIADIIKFENI